MNARTALPATAGHRVARLPLALLAAFVVIRLVCLAIVPAPYVLTDELLYAKLARAFLDGTPLVFRGEPIAFPSFLYPLVISPSALFADPLHAFRAIQIINVVLAGSGVVALYLTALRLVGPRVARWAAALALLPPYMLQSATAMSENLFFPLIAWATYLLVEALTRPEARWRYALAAVLGLAFLTKPHGMTVVPLAVLITWIAAAVAGRRPLGTFVGPALLYALFVAADVAVIGSLPGGEGPFDVSRLFGTYAEGLTGRRPFDFFAFAGSAAGNVAAIAAAVGFLPFVLFAWYAWRSLRGGPDADRAFVLWVVVLGGLLVALTARHTVTLDDPLRIHERYCFYVEPLILIGAVKMATLARPRTIPGIAALALIGPALIAARGALGTPIVADTLTLAATRPIVEVLGLRTGLLAAGAGAAIFVVLGVRALGQDRLRLAGGLLAGYLAALTGLAAVSQYFASQHAASRIPLARWVHERAPEKGVLAIVSAGSVLPDQLMIEFLARQPVWVFYDGLPQHHMNDRPLSRESGELKPLSALPDGSAIFASETMSLALPLLGATRDVALYEKRGPVRETLAIAGLYPDGWTNGRCVITETKFGQAVARATLRVEVDASSVPASMAPFRLTVRDGSGRSQTLGLELGRQQIVEAEVLRVTGKPFEVALESPTWSPAEAYKQPDDRRLGVLVRGAVFKPVQPVQPVQDRRHPAGPKGPAIRVLPRGAG